MKPSFPLSRVKKIVKLDRDIAKVTNEALLLVSLSADLFLASLSSAAADAAAEKRRRVVKLDHLRTAVRGNPPMRGFLLDCLLEEEPPPPTKKKVKMAEASEVAAAPAGARRIDEFFRRGAGDGGSGGGGVD
ncbi:hypothetical protein QJS10_CPA10g00559 [Acorus calamus]|uniref:Transcription factor CBF/NF-Y/archaeal histone domain-containing protein n=1 Tax=Acorus calamus TaxID=4465 RepID=A0AAV9E078_ACOCL|nr:hypothetical protein QJS10_CPA10g00559 [Acorus calamus]